MAAKGSRSDAGRKTAARRSAPRMGDRMQVNGGGPRAGGSAQPHREPPLPIDPQIAAIVAACHRDPFAFLGMHEEAGGPVVRMMLPDATAVFVIDAQTGVVAGAGELRHPDG